MRCECGCKSFVEDKAHGEIVCKKCGLIVQDNIIQSPTWTDSGAVYTKGLGTLGPNRLKVWDKRTTPSKDKRRLEYVDDIKRIAHSVGLTEVEIENVIKLYDKCTEKKLVKGRDHEAVIDALIYHVAKGRITFSDLTDASGVERREVMRTYKKILRGLNIPIRPAKKLGEIERKDEKI